MYYYATRKHVSSRIDSYPEPGQTHEIDIADTLGSPEDSASIFATCQKELQVLHPTTKNTPR